MQAITKLSSSIRNTLQCTGFLKSPPCVLWLKELTKSHLDRVWQGPCYRMQCMKCFAHMMMKYNTQTKGWIQERDCTCLGCRLTWHRCKSHGRPGTAAPGCACPDHWTPPSGRCTSGPPAVRLWVHRQSIKRWPSVTMKASPRCRERERKRRFMYMEQSCQSLISAIIILRYFFNSRQGINLFNQSHIRASLS